MWLELNNCQEQYLGQKIFDDIATLSDTIRFRAKMTKIWTVEWPLVTTSWNCISEFSNKLDHRRGSNDDSLATVIWHLYFLYNFVYDSCFISLAEHPTWRFNDALKIWPTSRAVIKLSAGSVRSRWLFNHPAPFFFCFVLSKIHHLVHSHPVLIVKITSW